MDHPFRYVEIGRDLRAKVSPEDYDRVMQHKWRPLVLSDGLLIYARTDIRSKVNGVTVRKTCLMHRIITNCPDKLQVDHGDHDGLNNTRPNLEVCGSSHNLANRRTFGGVSYKGVTLRPGGRYEAFITDYINTRINKEGKEVSRSTYIGMFATAEEAGRAHDKRALEMYGPFFKLNFPITDYPEYASHVETKREERSDAHMDVPF